MADDGADPDGDDTDEHHVNCPTDHCPKHARVEAYLAMTERLAP